MERVKIPAEGTHSKNSAYAIPLERGGLCAPAAARRAFRPWRAALGGKLSPNNKTNPADYPDDLTRSIAKILVDTKIGRYDATDLMPTAMRDAAWKAILAFVGNQNSLDSLLQGLDKVQSTAYTSS